MVKINFLVNKEQIISPENNLEKEVYGFLELDLGGMTYGFCPKESIPIEGADLLSTWFEQLTQTCLLLKVHSIVQINDVTSYNTWFRFQNTANGKVVIDQLVSDKKPGSQSISTQQIINAELGPISNYQISLETLNIEIIR